MLIGSISPSQKSKGKDANCEILMDRALNRTVVDLISVSDDRGLTIYTYEGFILTSISLLLELNFKKTASINIIYQTSIL